MSQPVLQMRPRRLRRLMALTGFGAILAGATIGTGVARADTGADYAASNAARICLTLDVFPNFAGIEGIAKAIVNEGLLSYWDAGRAIRVSVDYVCPQHDGLLDAYSAVYAPQGGGYVV